MSVFPHRSIVFTTAALVFSLLISMSITPLATAQTSGDELFAFYRGELHAWQPGSSTSERLTSTGYTGGPAISPDGRWIAYRAVAPEFVQVIESGADGETFAGDPPADIYMMDTATRAVTQVASQFVYPITRSAPVWSPDGTRIVWAQTAGEGPTVDVIVYDTRNGQMQQVATLELTYQDNGLVMPFLQWGNGGIARLVYSFGAASDGTAGEGLFWDIINPDAMNDVRRIPAVDMSVPGAFVVAWMWAEHQGQDHIVYADHTNTWFTLNTQTLVRSQLVNTPMLVRATGSQDSRLTPRFADPDTGLIITWEFTANGATVSLPYYPYSVGSGFGHDPVLSPDGRYAAWHGQDGGVHTWDSINNSWVTVLHGLSMEEPFTLGPQGVAWSPMKWVTDGVTNEIPSSNPVPETAPPTTMPESQPPVTDDTSACALPPRLVVGMAVQVTPGDPNRIRSAPSLAGAETGLLYHGTIATVQEGPVCADGLNWWRLSWDGGDGWTVEGANGVYWLEPVG